MLGEITSIGTDTNTDTGIGPSLLHIYVHVCTQLVDKYAQYNNLVRNLCIGMKIKITVSHHQPLSNQSGDVVAFMTLFILHIFDQPMLEGRLCLTPITVTIVNMLCC